MVRYRASRPPPGLGITAHGVQLQVNEPDYPGRPGAQLLPGNHAVGHHSVGRRSTHLQGFGGFVERDLAALRTFALAINRNAMRVSKTANMSARPAGAMRRRLSRAVQDGRDYVVRQLSRQYMNQIDDTGVGRPSSLADFVLLDLHLCVIAALPMDDKRQGLTDDIDNDFFDEQPDDLLACFD